MCIAILILEALRALGRFTRQLEADGVGFVTRRIGAAAGGQVRRKSKQVIRHHESCCPAVVLPCTFNSAGIRVSDAGPIDKADSPVRHQGVIRAGAHIRHVAEVHARREDVLVQVHDFRRFNPGMCVLAS